MISISGDRPVVVVDDNDADRHLMNIIIKHSKLENAVLSFEGGADLYTYMEGVRAGQEVLPALILLDVNMPGISGFDVLAELRSRPSSAQLLIVAMLSSSDTESDRLRAKSLGADEYLAKQSGLADFVSLIDKHFDNALEPGSI